MSNIKFKASKKTTIILLIVLFLIIGGTGGYLLWRVNQQDTVAPTDSSAGGGGQNGKPCCCDSVIGENCAGIEPCTTYKCVKPGFCNMENHFCGAPIQNRECNSDKDCCREYRAVSSNYPLCTCTIEKGCCTGKPQCTVPRPTCPYNCVWPEVSWYFTGELPGTEKGCQCAPCNYDRPKAGPYCLDNAPTCNPGACPAGYQEHTYDWNCNAMMNGGLDRLNAFLRENGVPNPRVCGDDNNDKICVTECKAKCAGCNNEYKAYRYCVKEDQPPEEPPEEPTPFCGDGNLDPGEECDPKDTTTTCPGGGVCSNDCTCPCDGIGKEGSITFTPSKTKTGGKIKYQYIMGDSKEIDLNSVTVLVNHGSLRVFYPKGIKVAGLPEGSNSPYKQARVEGELDSEIYKVGTNPVLIAWKRPGESTISSACQIRGNFVIEEETPTWGVEKSVVEECIGDGTENPSAKLRYTITITNKSTTAGTITSVVDTLDDKVVEGSVTDISDGGTYTHSDRTIRWGSFQIAAGQSKVLRYSITVSKDAFGIYDNVVVVKPSVGTDLVDNATITADCVIGETPQPPKEGGTVPDTGLFDESENIVVIGGILLFLGLGWTWLTKTYQIVNGKLVERSRERFEQRVVKK
ncbi:MAG TPA: hypothetical protein VJY47_01385 [Candidatus Dojkabacteria bacterium]|nr:hypothetical protein [Candidatus Dojkabacteria bacterium]